MIVASPLIKIRKAGPEDGGALCAVFRDCWRDTYAGIIPAMHLDQMMSV